MAAVFTADQLAMCFARQVKILSAVTLLCANNRSCQESVAAEPGIFVALNNWLTTPSKEVQVRAPAVGAYGGRQAVAHAPPCGS